MQLDGSQPIRYGIKMELDDKYRRLKEMVSELCAIPSSNLRLAEVYGAMVKVHVHMYIQLFIVFYIWPKGNNYARASPNFWRLIFNIPSVCSFYFHL